MLSKPTQSFSFLSSAQSGTTFSSLLCGQVGSCDQGWANGKQEELVPTTCRSAPKGNLPLEPLHFLSPSMKLEAKYSKPLGMEKGKEGRREGRKEDTTWVSKLLLMKDHLNEPPKHIGSLQQQDLNCYGIKPSTFGDLSWQLVLITLNYINT